MTKSARFLKKLKKVGQLIGKGVGWVNDNIVKPLRPVIDTALDMTGYGSVAKPILNAGSSFIDKYSGRTPQQDMRIVGAVQDIADYALDTQRAPAERKYVNPFSNRLNFD
jgi:hypothetical protein